MRMTTAGTGLGLFIARQLAEAMGGSLSVSSTLGVGSAFTLSLPLPADEHPAESEAAPPPHRPVLTAGAAPTFPCGQHRPSRGPADRLR